MIRAHGGLATADLTGRRWRSYVDCRGTRPRKDDDMTRTLIRALALLAAAARAAAAAEAGRPPARRDLDRLGVDPAAFASIGNG
jgi:hypothetical protein